MGMARRWAHSTTPRSLHSYQRVSRIWTMGRGACLETKEPAVVTDGVSGCLRNPLFLQKYAWDFAMARRVRETKTIPQNGPWVVVGLLVYQTCIL